MTDNMRIGINMTGNMGWGHASNVRVCLRARLRFILRFCRTSRLGFGCRSSAGIAAAARAGCVCPGGAAGLQLGRHLVGINGGWGWGNVKYTANAVGGFPGTTGSLHDNGGVVGGTPGANFQAGAFVFGVEGDWDYSGINTGTTASICTFSGQCQTGNNWLATVRGRAGYAADRVLFYLTAGGAFANVHAVRVDRWRGC
jgi:hypothetical protein